MTQIEDGMSIAPQIDISELEALAAAGVKMLINNRPDGEDGGQPTSEETQAAAAQHGIAYRHIPVTASTLSLDDIDRFASAMADADGPVLAYCRSGYRSALLWGLAEVRANGAAPSDVLQKAGDAGMDLNSARPLMEQMSGS